MQDGIKLRDERPGVVDALGAFCILHKKAITFLVMMCPQADKIRRERTVVK